MKLTSLLLFIACMEASAGGYAQKVSLSEKNAPLTAVFQQIKEQTGYEFWYEDQLLQKSHPVNISVKDAPLDNVLQLLFRDQPLTYEIIGKTIAIREKESATPRERIQVEEPPVPIEIAGTVSSEHGEPLAGASVIIQRTGRGTQTDAKGLFRLREVQPGDVLLVSYTGYTTESVKIGGKANLIIVLPLAENGLDELIVQAYGTTTRRTATGSVVKVSASEIERQPVANVLQALEGKVPGLFVSQNNGLPGSDLTVQIRGVNTISGGTLPLYIIDGVPFSGKPIDAQAGTFYYAGANGGQSPLNSISPSDIQSVEVLKDADATAIYGSRAANGVILITTKKGQAGKTRFTVNVSKGGGKVAKQVSELNTRQYLLLRHEAFANDGATPSVYNAPDLLLWDTTAYTDWQKRLIGGTAHMDDVSASYSGGDARTHFLLGGAWHHETTVFPGGEYYKRGSVHFNMDHFSSDRKFSMAVSGFYNLDNNNITSTDLTAAAYDLPPNYPLYDSTGALNWTGASNPLAYLNARTDSKTKNLVGNITARYNPLPGLNFKVNLGYNETQMYVVKLSPLSSQNPNYSPQASGNFTGNVNKTVILEPQADYSRSIGKGRITVLVGGTWQENRNELLYSTTASGFPSDDLLNTIAAASSINTSNAYLRYKYASLFGRITYNWRGKYIVNASARRDGSSNFGPDYRFGNFGAVGAAWVFSQEKALRQALPWLSFGKLRGSYGTVGNDISGSYQYLSTYASYYYPYGNTSSLMPSRIANPDYHWEVTRKLEAALELGLLKDRILVTAAWYRNRSGNQLVSYPLSAQAGFNSFTANFPALIQNSGWEFDVSSTNIHTRNLTWQTTFNISFSRNKLVSFPNLAASSYAYYYVEGQPLSLYRYFHFTGVDPATGYSTVADLDKSGNLGYGLYANGKGDYVIAGTPYPDFYGGLSNSLTWKHFRLDFLFQFVKQNGRSIYALINNRVGSMYNNYIGVLKRWRKPGDVTNIPAANTTYTPASSAFSYYTLSDITVGNTSFARLKNLSLSYSLPKQWTSAVKMEDCQLFVRGENLLTFTGYEGFDPETDAKTLPPLRMITAGFQCTF